MFPCKYLDKSKSKPRSVHKLRPGDIDVIAGLGDSITSGVGTLGRNVLSLRKEYRGVSFSMGKKTTILYLMFCQKILQKFPFC